MPWKGQKYVEESTRIQDKNNLKLHQQFWQVMKIKASFDGLLFKCFHETLLNCILETGITSLTQHSKTPCNSWSCDIFGLCLQYLITDLGVTCLTKANCVSGVFQIFFLFLSCLQAFQKKYWVTSLQCLIRKMKGQNPWQYLMSIQEV